jgi:transcriptional regulator with XRE-family HTH domain
VTAERIHGREPRGNMAGPIRLRDLRTKAGLSQRTLAARVGVSAAYVAMVERGLAKASPQYVADVLQALDVKRPYRARIYWAFEMIPPSIIEHLRENRVFFNQCFDAAEPYDGPLKYRYHDERDDPEDDPTDAHALRQPDAPRADVQPGSETPVGGT